MPRDDKHINEKVTRTIQAWETLRSEKSFAGLTLNQFKAKVKPALDARALIASLRDQLEGARRERNEANAVSLEAVNNVINAIRGDIDEGEDGALWAALGYVPKSERRSGLRRIVPLKKAA